MKKVVLTMDENNKYQVIKRLVETNGNKQRAAVTLNCTSRNINRLIKKYKSHGKKAFVHGNREKVPSNKLSEDTRMDIINLYHTKYADANFTHYAELLDEYEDIHVSASTIHNLLMEEYTLSPKARRSTKKRVKKELKDLQNKTQSTKKAASLQTKILDIDDTHPRRPRCAYFGEMLQMDASVHLWFGDSKSQLHVAIDDATGSIVGAYFDHQETLHGYYQVFRQVLSTHGIPYMFYTDRRTVFEYKQKKAPSIEEDSFTQFSYACHQLGVEIKATSVPQAKGRVERLFQTLQSRLTIELRLKGITTLSQANEFLNSYIKKFNDKFAIPHDNIKSVFEEQPSSEIIDNTLAVISTRKVDNGHSIKYRNNYYQLVDEYDSPVYFYKGTPVTVISTLSGKLLTCVHEKLYTLVLIPEHERSSRNFDFQSAKVANTVKKKKRTMPANSHPWKESIFKKYVNSNITHYDYAFGDLIDSQSTVYA